MFSVQAERTDRLFYVCSLTARYVILFACVSKQVLFALFIVYLYLNQQALDMEAGDTKRHIHSTGTRSAYVDLITIPK